MVGSTTIAADTKTDTLTLAAGTNVTITPDAANDKITISSKDTVYTHPSFTAKSAGLYKITVNNQGHVTAATAVAKADITALGIPAQDTKYTLPTASSTTLGGVKTTSAVTSTAGLTPCPIISGVPYYKDTNTTYTLSSFGITATAAELNKLDGVTATATEINYIDGVTSNIQTQLNGKAASSHNHSASNITSGTLPLSRGGTGGASATAARTSLGALNLVISSSEPAGQNTGDVWFKEV